MGRVTRKIPLQLAVGATCLLFYMLFWSGHHYSIDGVVMFQYAKALWFHHSFKMTPPVVWGSYQIAAPRWPIGMSLAYVPVLAVLSATIFAGDASFQQIPYKAGVAYNPELLSNRPYLYSSILNPVVTALSAVVLYELAIELGLSRRRAAASALIFGVASPAAVYAKLDFAQPLASLFLLAALLLLLRGQRGHSAGQLLWSGVSLGCSALVRPEVPWPSRYATSGNCL